MAINKKTIISVFDEKLTLMQWLKTINKALEDAVLTGVEVRQKGNATFSFVVTFEDGTELESNEFILAQGESINGATIRNGHLYLSLTNGNELDAGNLKPVTSFTINASQHLIVNYGDGTNQDLGAIFNGNVNIDGTLTANIIDGTRVTGNEIAEKMNGYSFTNGTNPLRTPYVSIVKNGNKITLVITGYFKKTETTNTILIGSFFVPTSIASKIVPFVYQWVDYRKVLMINIDSTSDIIEKEFYLSKHASLPNFSLYLQTSNDIDTTKTYFMRYEATFLLSDNMAS